MPILFYGTRILDCCLAGQDRLCCCFPMSHVADVTIVTGQTRWLTVSYALEQEWYGDWPKLLDDAPGRLLSCSWKFQATRTIKESKPHIKELRPHLLGQVQLQVGVNFWDLDWVRATVWRRVFSFRFNFKFSFDLTQIDFVVFKVHLTHAHAYAKPCHMSVLSVPYQKKTYPLYKTYE
jgi:hypothetical protein